MGAEQSVQVKQQVQTSVGTLRRGVNQAIVSEDNGTVSGKEAALQGNLLQKLKEIDGLLKKHKIEVDEIFEKYRIHQEEVDAKYNQCMSDLKGQREMYLRQIGKLEEELQACRKQMDVRGSQRALESTVGLLVENVRGMLARSCREENFALARSALDVSISSFLYAPNEPLLPMDVQEKFLDAFHVYCYWRYAFWADSFMHERRLKQEDAKVIKDVFFKACSLAIVQTHCVEYKAEQFWELFFKGFFEFLRRGQSRLENRMSLDIQTALLVSNRFDKIKRLVQDAVDSYDVFSRVDVTLKFDEGNTKIVCATFEDRPRRLSPVLFPPPRPASPPIPFHAGEEIICRQCFKQVQ